MKNYIVLLTGASGGIGQAIAEEMAKQGATLLLSARNEDKLLALQTKLNALNSQQHYYFSADISSAEGREALLAKAQTLDVNMLINAAGVSRFHTFDDINEAQLQTMFTINVTSTMLLTQQFLKPINDTTSKTVVNVGSALGSIGFPCYSSYCASKFALRGFTEALQRELSDTEHNIYYFAPRATATDINSSQVNAMNDALGNAVDDTAFVAQQLLKQLGKKKARATVGWPERLFVRLNGFLPELVDNALRKKTIIVKGFAKKQSN